MPDRTSLASVPACGTDSAYRRHLANGEDCPTCRAAHNERGRQDDKKRARARAQSRALKALARCFPIEYNALYLRELAEEGRAPEAAEDQSPGEWRDTGKGAA